MIGIDVRDGESQSWLWRAEMDCVGSLPGDDELQGVPVRCARAFLVSDGEVRSAVSVEVGDNGGVTEWRSCAAETKACDRARFG